LALNESPHCREKFAVVKTEGLFTRTEIFLCNAMLQTGDTQIG
jgi:hypothetical protein